MDGTTRPGAMARKGVTTSQSTNAGIQIYKPPFFLPRDSPEDDAHLATAALGASESGRIMTTADQDQRQISLCRIVTVPWLLETVLKEQLRCVVRSGIKLTLVANPAPGFQSLADDVGAVVAAIPMQRVPAPTYDLSSLFRLVSFFKRNRFDIVHSSTPKAGLLTALAGTIARVPVRIHTFTGQPWVELSGLRRRIPMECDRITGKLMTHTYADSPSQREFLIAEGLISPGKIISLRSGSIAGVDLERFSFDAWGGEAGSQTRRELGISSEALVIIFVGRVTKQKGIVELVEAFETTRRAGFDVHLIVIGPLEPERDPLPAETLHSLRQDQHIHFLGFRSHPEKYMGASDILSLPSYREGFGSVAVEAAALRLPTVVTRVTGLVDAVVENVTGLVVPAKDPIALTKALTCLLKSRELRNKLGNAGWQRVVHNFDARQVNAAVVAEYRRLHYCRKD
jgi:glycosyltransferase involved in cell wall biosynthesis